MGGILLSIHAYTDVDQRQIRVDEFVEEHQYTAKHHKYLAYVVI